MGLDTFLKAILRNWWLIVLSILLTAGSTAFFVLRQEPVYRATTTVELRPNPLLTDPRQVLNVLEVLNNATTANTVARKATASALQEQVAKKLGIPMKVVTDAGISAIVLPDTSLIEIRAQSTNPTLAADITNAVAESLMGQTVESVLLMEIVDRATPPATPNGPGPNRFIALAAVFGTILGIIFALLEEVLQRLRVPGRAVAAPYPAAFGAALGSVSVLLEEVLQKLRALGRAAAARRPVRVATAPWSPATTGDWQSPPAAPAVAPGAGTLTDVPAAPEPWPAQRSDDRAFERAVGHDDAVAAVDLEVADEPAAQDSARSTLQLPVIPTSADEAEQEGDGGQDSARSTLQLPVIPTSADEAEQEGDGGLEQEVMVGAPDAEVMSVGDLPELPAAPDGEDRRNGTLRSRRSRKH